MSGHDFAACLADTKRHAYAYCPVCTAANRSLINAIRTVLGKRPLAYLRGRREASHA